MAGLCDVAGHCHLLASPWSRDKTSLVPRQGSNFSAYLSKGF